MGLAEVKRKQRLVGSARTTNSAWSNDASLPGQRLLASMGWNAGQGLGANSEGSNTPISMPLKLDNTGIGVDRAQREAKAKNPNGVWIGANGELDALYAQLNAASGSTTPARDTPPTPELGSTVNSPTPVVNRSRRVRRRDRTMGSTPGTPVSELACESTLPDNVSIRNEEDESRNDRKKSQKNGEGLKDEKGERREKKEKRGKKEKRKRSDRIDGDSSSDQKQIESEKKKKKKKKERREETGADPVDGGKADAVDIRADLDATKNITSQYGVFQYLSNRLVVRRAQVRRERGIFAKNAHIV